MTGVNVRSEIGPLRKVILHRPGRELLNLTPSTLEELLFDDIPFLRVAQEEHDAFAGILRDRGVEVVYLEDLAAEVLAADEGVRDRFIAQWTLEAGIHTERYTQIVRDHLLENYPDPRDLVLKTMEGINLRELHAQRSDSLVDLVSDASKMVVAPMPNLYFTRDPFAMIGHGASLNRMYSATRNRETIYGEYVFAHHPDFAGTPLYYSRYNAFHIEGGDILNIDAKTLAVGISQRTEPDAVDQLARHVFDDGTSEVERILAFEIPSSRAFMHLDTVFTQIDVDKFTVHPGILGPLTVFEITPGAAAGEIRVREVDSRLEDILSECVGAKVELIQCGGGDRIAADREQWNDGSNTLCIAPGSIVVYERNEVTNAVLRDKGLDVIEMPSAELSRGRGGPRCMSMPVWRDDI
jgi:arginine deiminase